MSVTPRPPEFDALLIEYLPGLHALSKKLTKQAARQDLVTDTLINAMHRWQSFREDGGFWKWLVFTMRSTARDGRGKQSRKIETVYAPIQYEMSATPATQESGLMARDEIAALAKTKSGRTAIRRAHGESLREIAISNGVSAQAVSAAARAVRK